MNDFFVGLRVLFARLHVVFAIILLAWEVVIQNLGSGYGSAISGLRLVAQIFEITSVHWALIILVSILGASHFFWGYMLGSFITNPGIYESTKKDESYFETFINSVAATAVVFILIGLFVSLDAFVTI